MCTSIEQEGSRSLDWCHHHWPVEKISLKDLINQLHLWLHTSVRSINTMMGSPLAPRLSWFATSDLNPIRNEKRSFLRNTLFQSAIPHPCCEVPVLLRKLASANQDEDISRKADAFLQEINGDIRWEECHCSRSKPTQCSLLCMDRIYKRWSGVSSFERLKRFLTAKSLYWTLFTSQLIECAIGTCNPFRSASFALSLFKAPLNAS